MVGNKDVKIKYSLELNQLELDAIVAALGGIHESHLKSYCEKNQIQLMDLYDYENLYQKLKDLSKF